MVITNIPQLGKLFRESFLYTHEINSMERKESYYDNGTYYLTGLSLEDQSFRDSILLSMEEDRDVSIEKQLAIIRLSQQLLENSRSMEDTQLLVMNKTSERLFSKHPTHL